MSVLPSRENYLCCNCLKLYPCCLSQVLYVIWVNNCLIFALKPVNAYHRLVCPICSLTYFNNLLRHLRSSGAMIHTLMNVPTMRVSFFHLLGHNTLTTILLKLSCFGDIYLICSSKRINYQRSQLSFYFVYIPFSERFTVMSYNILADYLARDHRSKLYFHIPHRILDWEWRKRRILLEFGLWAADIICLQVFVKVFLVLTVSHILFECLCKSLLS